MAYTQPWLDSNHRLTVACFITNKTILAWLNRYDQYDTRYRVFSQTGSKMPYQPTLMNVPLYCWVICDWTVNLARTTSMGCVSIVANIPALAPAPIRHRGFQELLVRSNGKCYKNKHNNTHKKPHLKYFYAVVIYKRLA